MFFVHCSLFITYPTMKFIFANWKATKTRAEVQEWWRAFSSGSFDKKDVHVVVSPPSVYLSLLSELSQSTKLPFPLTIGAQDVSPFPDGTYTGTVTARMLKDIGVTHVIVGHSERRRWFHETPQDVALKVDQALVHDIIPIVSVDRENFRTQLGQFDDELLRRIILMYEPPEAISAMSGPIGTGTSVDITDIEEMVVLIKHLAPETPILYGGSVKSVNAKMFLIHPDLSGVVVGTASMDAQEFVKILNAA